MGARMLTLFVAVSVIFPMLVRPRLVCPINKLKISLPASVLECFVLLPDGYPHGSFIDLL